MKKRVFWGILALSVVACKPNNEYTEIPGKFHSSREYLGSASCKECHQKAYSDWQKSDHFKAMQLPTDSTVAGDFSNVTYIADGVSSRFFKKGEDFFIHTEGNDGAYHDYKVLYTFGYYPLQQYLVEAEGGRLQVMRQSWDTQKKRWFHQYENQRIPHTDWLHWTGNAQNWNMMCAYCHSTNLQKNYHPQTDTYTTSYSELTVGCESCHGAGKAHIDYFKTHKNTENAPKLLSDVYTQKTEINACMPCHSRRGELGAEHIFSNEVLDNFLPEVPAVPLYFPDGQVLEEDYKYASFLQSKMYQKGVRCSSCHNPHTTQLKLPGYKVCMQCHSEERYNTPKHTFHKDNNCINCHMPKRTYMGNDVRHDHVFRVPRPDLSEKYQVPNTCNMCHTNKSAHWAAEAVKRWYGKKYENHDFSEDLILSSFTNTSRDSALYRLLKDTIPAIIQATALHYMGEHPTPEQEDILRKKTTDKDAMVRYQAVRSLLNAPSEKTTSVLLSCLNDKVRAVRVAAADVLLTQNGIEQMQHNQLFEKARNELEQFLLHQSDFASGSAALADYYMKINQLAKARLFYERALKKDAQLNYVRINLASLYSGLNDNEKALSVLKEALDYDSENQDIIYRLALLLYQLHQYEDSAKNFQKALKLNSTNIRIYYNYALLLNEMGQKEKALSVVKKGLEIDPENTDLQSVMDYIL